MFLTFCSIFSFLSRPSLLVTLIHTNTRLCNTPSTPPPPLPHTRPVSMRFLRRRLSLAFDCRAPLKHHERPTRSRDYGPLRGGGRGPVRYADTPAQPSQPRGQVRHTLMLNQPALSCAPHFLLPRPPTWLRKGRRVQFP